MIPRRRDLKVSAEHCDVPIHIFLITKNRYGNVDHWLTSRHTDKMRKRIEFMPKGKPKSTEQKKPTRNAPAKPAPVGVPLVDTSLAAETAAKMLLRRPNTSTPATSQKESGTFKSLKESLNKPNLGGLDQVIGSIGPQRSNLPHQRDQQKGHNQTFGADVNRTGVPRRTPG